MARSLWPHFLAHPVEHNFLLARLAEYCGERVCVCVFVSPRAYLRSYMSDLH